MNSGSEFTGNRYSQKLKKGFKGKKKSSGEKVNSRKYIIFTF